MNLRKLQPYKVETFSSCHTNRLVLLGQPFYSVLISLQSLYVLGWKRWLPPVTLLKLYTPNTNSIANGAMAVDFVILVLYIQRHREIVKYINKIESDSFHHTKFGGVYYMVRRGRRKEISWLVQVEKSELDSPVNMFDCLMSPHAGTTGALFQLYKTRSLHTCSSMPL